MTRWVPQPWEFAILALAAYRWTRLAGWDEFPLAARIRAWVIGEYWVADIPALIMEGERMPLEPSVEGDVVKIPGPGNFFIDGGDVPLPGKQPSSGADAVRPAYARPTLAHLVHCPFCIGAWISLATWGAWVAGQNWTLAASTPFAISGVVGLISKNWDQ